MNENYLNIKQCNLYIRIELLSFYARELYGHIWCFINKFHKRNKSYWNFFYLLYVGTNSIFINRVKN